MGDNKSAQQPDVNEQIKVRMEKLKNLQDAGKDLSLIHISEPTRP